MNLFVLSELQFTENHVGWLASYDLEEVLAETCNATFIYPEPNDKIRLLKRYRHRIFKSWYKANELPTLGEAPNVLLLIGMTCESLLMMLSLGSLIENFDVRLAYLFDIYEPQYLDRDVIPYLDYLFLPIAEIADEVNEKLRMTTTFLPHAFNVLKFGSNQRHRCIDVMSYGRGNVELHKCLQEKFNQVENNHTYFHSTFTLPQVNSYKEHRMLLSKLLSKSKINLCFEPSKEERFQGHSPLLTRWFEGWAAGCTIVGKRPFGKKVADLLDWQNSTIEIPDTPSEWLPFFEDLLSDNERLLANSERNYRECLLRHDWRYRVRDMFQTVGLPIPEKLNEEIGQLKQKAQLGLIS
ncbi:MAG TPA: glycosyltransferase [Coleofasciculaceae cyanobacterium]|jgi:hypothetical protein